MLQRLDLNGTWRVRWPVARVNVRLEQGQAVLTSTVFALGVCIDLDGEQALPHNFFDVFPDQEVRLPWPGAHPPRILFVGNLA